MALGAEYGHVLRLVVREGMTLTVIGLVCGILAALASTRVMASLLFDTRASDPLTLAAVAAFSRPWHCWRVTSRPGGPPVSTRWWRCVWSSARSNPDEEPAREARRRN